MAKRQKGDTVKFKRPSTYMGTEGGKKIMAHNGTQTGIVKKVMPSGVMVEGYGFVKHNQLYQND